MIILSNCPLLLLAGASKAENELDECDINLRRIFVVSMLCAYRSFKLEIGPSVPFSLGRLALTRLSDSAHNNSGGKKDGCEE